MSAAADALMGIFGFKRVEGYGMKQLTPYQLGWNAWFDSASIDDNPWTETTESGCEWVRGMIDCERAVDEHGSDYVERYK